MDQAGKKLFANAGLPFDQDREPGGGDAVCRVNRVNNRGASADNLQICAVHHCAWHWGEAGRGPGDDGRAFEDQCGTLERPINGNHTNFLAGVTNR